jgi:hypothetical protein
VLAAGALQVNVLHLVDGQQTSGQPQGSTHCVSRCCGSCSSWPCQQQTQDTIMAAPVLSGVTNCLHTRQEHANTLLWSSTADMQAAYIPQQVATTWCMCLRAQYGSPCNTYRAP